MGITSTGIGSGLDVQEIVTKLVAAEGQPATNRLNIKEAKLQAELAAWGSIKGALSSFRSSLSGLASTSTFNRRSVDVSDDSFLTATAATTADVGDYSIEVTDLAKAHSLSSSGSAFAATTDSVGTGTLTFRFGTWSGSAGSYSFSQNPDTTEKSLVIDASNNSLEGLRDAINDADMGVKAAIVNDGTGYRLTLTSASTGAAQAMEISVAGATGSLGNLAFDAASRNDGDATNNMSQTIGAQDAALTVNGLAITSSTNIVTEAIDGVTLTLKKETSGSPVSVGVAFDRSAVKTAINNFVSGYNSLVESIKKYTSYDAEAKKGGVLLGDSGVRGIEGRLRSLINQSVTGVSGSYSTLAELGITTNEDGKLEVDSSQLDEVLESAFEDVAGIFTEYGKSSDSLVSYVRSTAATVPGQYSVTVNTLATQGAFQGAGGITSVTLDGTNNTFALKVDGVATGTINLVSGTYDTDEKLAELAAQMQSKINGDTNLLAANVAVTVTYDSTADRFVFTSERYGSSSKVEVYAANGDIGVDGGGTGSDGVDVAGTIGGITATGSGRYLTGMTGTDVDGLRLEIRGGSTGSRGTVAFARGVGSQLKSLLDDYLDTSDGMLAGRTGGLQSRIEDIGEQRALLADRLASLEKRYLAQFNALDALMAGMQSTSSYLTTQLGSLPGARRS